MARLVEEGAEVRYVAFSIATRSLPEGFAPDTLAREVTVRWPDGNVQTARHLQPDQYYRWAEGQQPVPVRW